MIEHPTRGTFSIDTGVERAMRDAPERAVLRGPAASAMHAERLQVRQPLGQWLQQRDGKLAGVLLTHLHADHVMGLPDVPRGTPIYVGPGETTARSLMNVVVQPLIDDYLAGLARGSARTPAAWAEGGGSRELGTELGEASCNCCCGEPYGCSTCAIAACTSAKLSGAPGTIFWNGASPSNGSTAAPSERSNASPYGGTTSSVCGVASVMPSER